MIWKKKRMIWVIFGVILSYLIVNLPLLYSLRYIHGINGISKLWGYAPNQFLFLVLVFPIATFFSLLAFIYFVKDLYAKVPLNSKIVYFFDNYPVFFLCCIIFASILSIIVYYTSAWSFDKLEPQYTEKTFDAIRQFEKEVENSGTKQEEQNLFRKKSISEARDKLEEVQKVLPTQYEAETIDQFLNKLEPTVYLQVVHNKDLSRTLRLVNPVIQVLNISQIFFSLLITSFLLFITALSLYFAKEINYDGTNSVELKHVFNLIFWAAFYFSFYAICFRQYRYQIEELVGTGTTILQDTLVVIVVTAVLIGIKFIETRKLEFSITGVTPFLPILAPFAGITIESFAPEMMKQYIGTETTFGFQLIFSLIFLILSFIPMFFVLRP